MSGLKEWNGMDREAFANALGGVFEHSPWIAEEAWERRPFASVEELHEAMLSVVRNAPDDRVLALIRSHPDLATRLGIGSLTAFSAEEQKGAGLDRLTPEEFATFSALNEAYKAKFGFPFIFAVRGRGKEDILAAMRQRLDHAPEQELQEALAQIARIAGFRLRDLIAAERRGSGRLTTHVLDISRGKPAEGMRVQLYARDEQGGAKLLREAFTNADGRVDRPLLEGAEMQEGLYELVFGAGDYFRGAGSEAASGGGSFLEQVPVRFRVADADAHYHVPLLAAPGGYSTYRGS